MTIKGILLAGASLCTLTAGSAFASTSHAPQLHVSAMHPGAARIVNKTTMHAPSVNHVTYTFGVYTYISTAAAYKTKTKLAGTYYKFNSTVSGVYSICTAPKEKIKLASKKTTYAKLSTSTETYSLGCSNGPTVFYGDVYELETKSAVGSTDSFASTLTAKYKDASGKYLAKLTLDVSVDIGS